MQQRSRLRVAPAIASLLAACGAPPHRPADPPRPESTASTKTVEVSISRTADGLAARFEVGGAVEHIAFEHTAHVRRDAWRSATPGVTLAADGLHAPTPLHAFEIVIEPDVSEHDRVYPSLTRVGDGMVLYGPALQIADHETLAQVVAGPGASVWPPGVELSGYLYIGPLPETTQRGSFRIIGDDTVAPWLSEAIASAADASLGFYANVLDRPTRAPSLFVTGAGPGPMSFHGDVTENAVIFLRFHGAQWDTVDSGAGRKVATFVRHEAFHLWNASYAAQTPPWLHEGGAEYAALVAGVQSGVLTQAQGIEQIGLHVARCRRAIGEHAITELPDKGAAVYDCGVALLWLADVEARHASNGKQHTFTLWRTLLERADAHDGYTVTDFRDATGDLVALLLDEQPDGRWPLLSRALQQRGVVVSDEPSAADHRSAAIKHLLRVHCGDAPHGYWTESQFLRLDTGQRCGPLSGDPEVVALEGHDLFEAPKAAFEAVTRRCAQSENVEMKLRTGPPRSIGCTTVPELPPTFTIVSAPELSM